MAARLEVSAVSAADEVHFDLLEPLLAADLRRSLGAGIKAEARMEGQGGPAELFRSAVRKSIRSIEARSRARLLEDFLVRGPCPEFISELAVPPPRYMPDDEVAAAIRFIHSAVINTFQGALAEMLAIAPVCEIVEQELGDQRSLLYLGDSVLARKSSISGWGKAADMHLLARQSTESGTRLAVLGVAEVKSYSLPAEKLQGQLSQHLRRARGGLLVTGEEVSSERIVLGTSGKGPLEIAVVPAGWRLSREIRFEEVDGELDLAQLPMVPPDTTYGISRQSSGKWLVTLRWSQEALAAVAYGMTFWFLGELGRALFEKEMHPELTEMTPERAGQNQAKASLYYSVMRSRTSAESSRAIALYNTYAFGYSLGSNFVDKTGRREILFPVDLEEIAANGVSRTKELVAEDGRKIPPQLCRIRG